MDRSSLEMAIAGMQVIRRNGDVVAFVPEKIAAALSKAFIAVKGEQTAVSSSTKELVSKLAEDVVQAFTRRLPSGGTLHIEDIQDQVELALMRSGEHEVARAYVLYRERRAAERAAAPVAQASHPVLHVLDNGKKIPLNQKKLLALCERACSGLSKTVSAKDIFDMTLRNLYDGVPLSQVYQALVLSARTKIELEPDYNKVAARLLLVGLAKEALQKNVSLDELATETANYFPQFIKEGIKASLLDPKLKEFDLVKLAGAIEQSRDDKFGYLGLQTLYDRYFLHIEGRRIELPQIFFMRVAMGLSLNEVNREERAIEFYSLLSQFDFMCSTPTLFNSGTQHSQLSSCYLTTVSDDLDGIYQAIKENALLQKYAGGIGNDWTQVRALGSRIKGTNGESQGVIPFLKVANDTALAVNQGGKRKGAVCAYLESWHLDIEDFLDLRKNTGDERRRTHDMNTANWVPDLFMKRVIENGDWTLFSPVDVPDLHDKYGKEFEKAYTAYEELAEKGKIKLFKKISAVQLWRKMLGMLFETGHPWITFKDPCNIRSPQQHAGVVHNSNLCTEITLNTSESEIAVCNLGSINLPAHLKDGGLDTEKLARTVKTAIRMLDNVIDINYYASPKARNSNVRHRPIGLGLMGFADCLYTLGIPYASQEAVEFADISMEQMCYYAYLASTELAKERGVYPTFEGSLWDKGVLPHESIDMLEKERGGMVEVDRTVRLDWAKLKGQIKKHGMRNSNCVAVAPTATISNIVGVSQGIEPTYQNLFVKSNLSGEFTVMNDCLVHDLKKLGLWDEAMIADLKYYDGSLAQIDRVPDEIKGRYATAFEIDSIWLVEAAARRQKWIDQSQSLNIYLSVPSGKKMDEIYKLAWLRGLKTTYYLRSLGASQMETSASETRLENGAKACSIDNPDCEACQ